MDREAIICVDDESIILLSLVEDIKEHFGERFIYKSSTSSIEVLSLAEDLTAEGIIPVLIVSDWLMPGLKGDELISELAASNPGIKGVLVTGHYNNSNMVNVKENPHIHEIISKPWRRQHLMSVLETVIGV